MLVFETVNMGSRGVCHAATVNRLRQLTKETLLQAQLMKKSDMESRGEKVKQVDMMERNICRENVMWDFGWFKQLTFLAERGEVVAFNCLFLRLDTVPKDQVYDVFKETRAMELVCARYGDYHEGGKKYLVPFLISKKIIPNPEQIL